MGETAVARCGTASLFVEPSAMDAARRPRAPRRKMEVRSRCDMSVSKERGRRERARPPRESTSAAAHFEGPLVGHVRHRGQELFVHGCVFLFTGVETTVRRSYVSYVFREITPTGSRAGGTPRSRARSRTRRRESDGPRCRIGTWTSSREARVHGARGTSQIALAGPPSGTVTAHSADHDAPSVALPWITSVCSPVASVVCE